MAFAVAPDAILHVALAAQASKPQAARAACRLDVGGLLLRVKLCIVRRQTGVPRNPN